MSNLAARILVVDDAPLIRGLLAQVLRKYGYLVDTAEDGQQAIDYFICYQPDLILMDADMPVLDGVAACAQIRQLPQAKHLPIIMVTSFVERKWVDRAYAAGATDYITKPVNWDVLRNRIHYILQAKHAEEALFDEKEKAQVTLASIGDGVITTDAKGQVEYLNPVATKLTGWSTEEAQGLPLPQVFSIVDEASGQPVEFPLNLCLKEGKIVEIASNTVLHHRDQSKKFAIEDSAAPIRDRNNQIIGVVLVFHDVTENRKLTQELSFKANHDALTGLYNLHEFKARLQRLLATRRQHHQSQHVLLYMDLDQFKIVNDTCGHEAGDQLLKNVALILQKQTEKHKIFKQATLARLGGDEFGLLLEECKIEDALPLANCLRESIEKLEFFWSNDKKEKSVFTIGISIGLVPISNETVNRKSLLAMADAACYAAKNSGRNNVHIYRENDAELLERHKEIQWLSLINDNLERARGFSLFYQPIISSNPSKNYHHHYEVLLRMDDQQGHLLPPGAFLSTAARYNLMPTLDRWVVQTVLAWLKAHPEYYKQLALISVNISGHSLNDKEFLQFMVQQAREMGSFFSKLCFEIPETVAITHFTNTLHFITTLKKSGCYFALDDFGSGMASFSYLKNLPIDFLKIDGSLIRNLVNDPIDYEIINSINYVAKIMNIKTIAEGVETQPIFRKLKEVNVDYVQGYYIGEPKILPD